MNCNPKNQFQKGHKINLGRKGFWNGKEFSKEHLKHLSEAHIDTKLPERSGKNHWNWKGGITSYQKLLRVSQKWIRWRKSVFERDNYTCQKCGYKYEYNKPEKRELHPHHLFRVKDLVKTIFEKHIFNINNGITLCKLCHKNL